MFVPVSGFNPLTNIFHAGNTLFWVIFGNPALELQSKDVLENTQLSGFQEMKQNYGLK